MMGAFVARSFRRGKMVERFTVQLEIRISAQWVAIVRYDNAHGFCHRDTLHPDGTQEKVPIYRGAANSNFTWAIEDLRANWQFQRARFLAEIKP